MQYSKFDFMQFQIIETVKEYSRTASGKGWKSRPDSETVETITGEQYANSVNAVSFFRALGGSERVERGYTCAGYIPVKITSVSPSRHKKVIREYRFSC